MKWIYFIDEIDQFLDEDEEILWSRKKIVNLLSIIPFILKAGIIFTLFCLIFIIYSFFLGSVIGIMLILSFYTFGLGFLIVAVVKSYRTKTKTIQLNRDQLKEYEFFYIITNKRYIRKDYYYHYKRDFSKYPKNAFYQIGDSVFLNFDYVDEILVDYVLKEVNFKIKGFPEGRAFFLEFKEIDELEKIMEIIQTVIPLEILENKRGGIDKDIDLYTKYTRKK